MFATVDVVFRTTFKNFEGGGKDPVLLKVNSSVHPPPHTRPPTRPPPMTIPINSNSPSICT